MSLAGWPGSSSAFSSETVLGVQYSPFMQAKNIAYPLSFFLWALLAMRGGERLFAALRTRWMCWVFSALFAAGGLLCLVPMLGAGGSLGIEVLSGALMGVGLSGNFTLWVNLFSGWETPADARSIVGGTLVGGLVYFMLSWLPDLTVCALAIVVIAPGTSALLVWCSSTGYPVGATEAGGAPGVVGATGVAGVIGAAGAVGATGPGATLSSGGVAFPRELASRRDNLKKGILALLMPCLTIGTIGAVMQLLRLMFVGLGSSDLLYGNANSLGLIASSVIVWVFFERSGYHVDMSVFYRICAPLIGLAVLGLPVLGTFYGYVLAFVIYTIFSIASVMGIVACMQVARYYRIPPVAMYALTFGIIYATRIVPALAMSAMAALENAGVLSAATAGLGAEGVEAEYALVCMMLMFAAYVLSDRYRRTQEIAEVYSWESKLEPSFQEVVQMAEGAVARFAQRSGLTGRETEVVSLLAMGRSVPVIASQLGITQNTVRFHCKNVYDKLGVHSKQELLALIDERTSDGRESESGAGE